MMIIKKIINFLKRPEVKLIIVLFLITRIVLSFIGFSSRIILEPYDVNNHHFEYSDNTLLSIWGVWDTGYYLDIVKNGYNIKLGVDEMTMGQGNYAFFPLYPLSVKLVDFLFNSPYFSGLLVSNICLILAAFVLYKLVSIDYKEKVAKRSVIFLFLFPTSFILSGFFSESLFLLLLLLVFYYTRKREWCLSSVFGFLLTLTRPLGILVFIPVVYEYLKDKEFRYKNIDYKALYLFLFPLALILFLSYVNYLTGDYLNYYIIQSSGWGHILSNPILVLFSSLISKDIFQFVNVLIILFFLGVFLFRIHKIRISYTLIAVLLFIFPLLTGPVAINSILRYLLPIFPIYIILSLLSKNRITSDLLIIILALLQGFLMVFWTNGLHLIV